MITERFVMLQGGRAHWIFDRADMPEWNGDDVTVVPYPREGYQPSLGDQCDSETGQWAPAPEAIAQGAVPMTRADMLAIVTARRWTVETGGIVLPDGTRVGTSLGDQNRITSVIANAAAAGVEAVDFKSANGWTTLTLEQLRGVAAAIALHVQAAFSAERRHHEAIAALSDDALATYDITTGWPPNAPPAH